MKSSKRKNKLVVSEIREKKADHVNPVLVTFQNGYLDENYASDVNVFLTPNRNKDGTNVEVITPSGHVYKNSEFNGVFENKHYIAIRNKKTNKIKLVEVDFNVLINDTLISFENEEEDKKDYWDSIKKLQKSFGAKKIANEVAEREKYNVNLNLLSQEVKETVADMEIKETLVECSNTEIESLIDLLPPSHRQASSLSEVYLLNEILTEEELSDLKAEVLKNKKFDATEYSRFFIYCHEEAKKTEKDIENRLAGLQFAEVMIKFLKIPSKKLTSRNLNLCSFSNAIHSKIFNEFCVKTGSSVTRPLSMRDKCMCYIIVICLICCNFKINLQLLGTVTSMHLKKLSQLARVVGAVPLNKDESNFVLKLPLPTLPKTRKQIKRK